MKLGFACKYIDYRGKQPFASRSVNFTQLSKLDTEQQKIDKLIEIAGHNVAALFSMIEHVARQRPDLRMFRITSDLFPLFTHPKVRHLYQQHVVHIVSPMLAACGTVARRHKVRLSFHPGQFTVLASDKPHVVNNSIEELEYHTWCAVQMGYGQKFQDFKINIHLSGAGGSAEFRRNFGRLSRECRRMLTVENDEVSSSIEACLTLADLLPVVLDIHHHWVYSNEYIQPRDSRVQQVIDSWRGVRPTMHFSVSRSEFVPSDSLPDQNKLSVARGKLRAHSDYYHNDLVNAWALSFDQFDVMCESKAKNLARTQLLLDKPYSANMWSKDS